MAVPAPIRDGSEALTDMATAAQLHRTHRISKPGHTTRFAFGHFLIVAIALWFPGPLSVAGGMSLTLPWLLIAAVFSARGALLQKRGTLEPRALHSCFIVVGSGAFICIWAVASVLEAPDPLRAGRVVLTHLSGAAILITLYATFTLARVQVVVRTLVLAGAGISALALASYVYEPLYPIMFPPGSDRAAAFFKNPNQLGMALSTIAPVALASAMASSRWSLPRLLPFAMILFGLVASGSKFNLLLFVSLATLLCAASPLMEPRGLRRFSRTLKSSAISAVVAVGTLIALANLNPRVLTVMETFATGQSELRTVETRKVLWRYSLEKLAEHPLLGEGAGQILNVSSYGHEDVTHSHNAILDYGRMLGVPGLFLITLMLAAVAASTIYNIIVALKSGDAPYRDRIVLAALSLGTLSYVLANMSSDSLGPSTSPFFWITFYLSLLMASALRTASVAGNETSQSVARFASHPRRAGERLRIGKSADSTGRGIVG